MCTPSAAPSSPRAPEEEGRQEEPPATPAGDEEDQLEVALRQDMMEYDAHDRDRDQKLDFDEFCALVAERETGHHSVEELRQRFEELDADHSGKVDLHEYLRFSLLDHLSRQSTRVLQLFKKWDTDGSLGVDKPEFRRAVRALGFDVGVEDIDLVFDGLDEDRSGVIDARELQSKLRPGTVAQNKHALRKVAAKRKGGALSASERLNFDPG
eukprot:48343-Prymnesium_polylepis.1